MPKAQATYLRSEFNHIVVGSRAMVSTVVHPTHSRTDVITSRVLSHDVDTGVFETLNTIYTPTGE